jgi:hypothetical protein
LAIEELAHEVTRACVNHQGSGGRHGLEVERLNQSFADYTRFLTGSRVHIGDHHKARRDAYAYLELLSVPGVEFPDRSHQFQTGPHGALGIVLACRRIAEIRKYIIAKCADSGAADALDDSGTRQMNRLQHLLQIFGIEPGGEFGYADNLARQHRQLPAFRHSSSAFGSLQMRHFRGGFRWLIDAMNARHEFIPRARHGDDKACLLARLNLAP